MSPLDLNIRQMPSDGRRAEREPTTMIPSCSAAADCVAATNHQHAPPTSPRKAYVDLIKLYGSMGSPRWSAWLTPSLTW